MMDWFCSLIPKTDADALLKRARKLEYLGAQTDNDFDSETIWFMARKFISGVLASHSRLLHDDNFCYEFGKIACVPAEIGYPFDLQKRNIKRVLCSFSDAILLKDWALGWTVAPILRVDVPPGFSWSAVQLINSPPPFTLVLKHMQVI